MSKQIGLLGYPVGHSISPAIHQAAFDYYGLDIRYVLWETPPLKLRKCIEGLRDPNVVGANVTIPYKGNVMSHLDNVSEWAGTIGAINTIVNRSGKLVGYNTDGIGFLQALALDAKFKVESKRTLVIGSGGVARSVAWSLLRQRASTIGIVGRSGIKTKRLVNSLTGFDSKVEFIPWENQFLFRASQESDLIVNCTPLGMRHSSVEKESPLPATAIPSNALVFDLVYNPRRTELLRQAEKAGAQTLSGLTMLVYQGAASFEIWTGKKAPLAEMLKSAQMNLEKSFVQEGSISTKGGTL